METLGAFDGAHNSPIKSQTLYPLPHSQVVVKIRISRSKSIVVL